jgi:radical SAM superfamily enzyme YgiQ (UPF0313 family)
MKITFVGLGAEQLGIEMLSAVLRRAGHSTSLVFNPALFHDRYYLDVPVLGRLFDRTAQVIDEIVAEKPDLVAFGVLTPVYPWVLEVARAVKARTGVPIVVGGVHPSAVPEICLENDCIDYVCVGEGEQAIVELCDAIAGGAHRPAAPIPNLWWRDGDRLVRGPAAPFLQDLDSLPYFDKELYERELRLGDNYITMASRGCPYRCTFCFNNFFATLPGKGSGKYVRQRSVEHLMGELVLAKRRWNIRRIDFEDDIFTVDKRWLRALLDEYRREIDVPFQCLVHPRYMDAEIARWLKDAGCQHVQMGVQSADEEYKRKQLLRMEKDAHLEGALAALAAVRLDTKLDHILGLPDEPPRAQELARQLYIRFTPRDIQTFWLTHLPGVEITRHAVETGHLSREDYARIQRGETRLFHSTEAGPNDENRAFYARYELLFQLLPLLPARARGMLEARHLPALSPRTAAVSTVLLKGLNLLVKRDAEAFNYLRYYAHQVGKAVRNAPNRARTLPPVAAAGFARAPKRRLQSIPAGTAS